MVDATADLVVSRSLTIPSGELRWRFSGSGGPGGQHANTSNTKVTLTWNIEASAATSEWQRQRLVAELGPVVRVAVTDERSQTRNRDMRSNVYATVCRATLDSSRAPTTNGTDEVFGQSPAGQETIALGTQD